MDVAELARDIAELQAANAKPEEERDRYRKLYQEMLEKARKLELGLLRQKAERLPPSDAQLSLQLLAGLLGEREASIIDDEVEDSGAEAEAGPAKPRRKPTGRKPIPEHLPVVEFELIPDDVMEKGLEHFDRVGEEVISTIERRPSAFVHCRIRRPKFLPKDVDVQVGCSRSAHAV